MKVFSDEVIDRRGRDSIKWDWRAGRFGTDDVLPLGIADGDLPVCPAIVEAIISRARHPFYGYTKASRSFYECISGWITRRTEWNVDPDWITLAHGVVPALNLALRAFCRRGDKVIVQPPVYFPFFPVIKNQGCRCLHNQLILRDGRYEIDFEDLEKKAGEGAKAFIFCSPHNPVGRVWTQDELKRVEEICLRHNMLLISDEIHGDIILPGNRHIPSASLSSDLEKLTVACWAPSKTFNLPGLQLAAIIIPDIERRNRFREEIGRIGLGLQNPLSMAAVEAGYTQGEPWLEEFIKYVHGNFERVRNFLALKIPAVGLTPAQGTYLAWLDCRGLGMNDEALEKVLIEKCRLGMDEGRLFGRGGEGFQRMNLACPGSVLEEALSRFQRVLE